MILDILALTNVDYFCREKRCSCFNANDARWNGLSVRSPSVLEDVRLPQRGSDDYAMASEIALCEA